MSGHIRRAYTPQEVSLTTSATTTPEIPFEDCAGGAVFVPTGSTITLLTYHAAPKTGGTYLPLYDKDGNAVTQTVAAARAYPLPVACYGAGALRIVANNAGAVTLNKKG